MIEKLPLQQPRLHREPLAALTETDFRGRPVKICVRVTIGFPWV